MRFRLLSAAAICAVTGCAPRSGGAPPPPVARRGDTARSCPATGQQHARHAAVGPHSTRSERATVCRAPTDPCRAAVPRQTQVIDRGFRLFLAATIAGPADSAGYPLSFTLDSIVPDSGSAIPPTVNLASARGLRYSGRLTPAGEFARRRRRTRRSRRPSRKSSVGSGTSTHACRRAAWRWAPSGPTRLRRVTAPESTSPSSPSVTPAPRRGSSARAPAACVSKSAPPTRWSGGRARRPAARDLGNRDAHWCLLPCRRRALPGRRGQRHVGDRVGLPVQGMTVPVRQVSHATIAVLP